jgi:hypothetical protein
MSHAEPRRKGKDNAPKRKVRDPSWDHMPPSVIPRRVSWPLLPSDPAKADEQSKLAILAPLELKIDDEKASRVLDEINVIVSEYVDSVWSSDQFEWNPHG